MELKELEGSHKLSGVDYMPSTRVFDYYSSFGNDIIFCLDGKNYIMTEDENDGYRSYMTELETTDKPIRNIFPEQEVECKYVEEYIDEYGIGSTCEILEIYSLDGKLIMQAGTDTSDGYYPYTVFNYHPENMDINKGVKLENDDSK